MLFGQRRCLSPILLAPMILLEPATLAPTCDLKSPADEEISVWTSKNSSATRVLDIGTALTLDARKDHDGMGRLLRHAYTFYFDWLNDKYGGLTVGGEKYQVRLHLLDDKREATRVANITRYLLYEKRIRHFLAPYGSTLTGSAASVLNESDAVMVSGCAASPQVFIGRPRMFGVLPKTNTFLEGVFPLLRSKGVETVGYIYEDLAFTRGVCSAVESLADGMRIIFSSNFTFDHSDPNATVITDLMATVADREPQVFIGCVYAYACKHILEAAAKANYNPDAIVLTICVTTDDYRTVNKDRAGVVMGVAPWTREMQWTSELTRWNVTEFVQEFELSYGSRIAYQAVASFAAAAALTYAIQAAGTVTDPGKVAEMLRMLNKKSVFGQINFDENGQGRLPIKVVQAQADKTPIVSLGGTSRLIFPKPPFSVMPCLNTNKFLVGQYGIDPFTKQCSRCKDTEYAPFNASHRDLYDPLTHRVCQNLTCAAGFRSVIVPPTLEQDPGGAPQGGAFCLPCTKGYFSGDAGATQCRACGVGKYLEKVGSTSCIDCIPGKHSSSKAAVSCQACDRGRFSSEPGASRCRNCPHGSHCVENAFGITSNFTNANGFYNWRDADGNRILLRCQHGEDGSACVVGEKCHVDPDTGEESMEGPFCGKCRTGYGRHKDSDLCERCPSNATAIILVLVQFIAVLVVATSIYLLVLLTDFTKPKNINAVILKQLFNYMSMTTVIFEVTDFRMPIELGFVTETLTDIKVFLTASAPGYVARAGDCLLAQIGPVHQMHVIMGLTWIPLWSILLLLAFWIVRFIQMSRGIKPPRRSRQITLLIVNLFVIQPLNTELCLSAFRCKFFDKSRLLRDTTIECGSSEHWIWQLLGLLGFFLYSLGFPLCTYFLLRHYKRCDALSKRKTVNSLGFLYSGFEPRCYYFESLFMFRKVLYQLVVVLPILSAEFDQDDRTIKCMSLLLLAVIFLAIHLAAEPYDNRSYFALDKIEEAMLWAILMTLLMQTWIYISDKAYAFDAEANGDADGTKVNANIRDGIAFTVVVACHVYTFCLVIFMLLRSTVARVASRFMNWRVFNHGTVAIRSDSLVLHQADNLGRKLFATMFEELAELLVEGRGFIDYDEFITSLEYMTLMSLYYRKRDQYKHGWDDDEDENLRAVVSESLQQRSRWLHHLHRCKRFFRIRDGERKGDGSRPSNYFYGDMGDGSRPSEISTSTDVAAMAAIKAVEELERLKVFDEETKKETFGQRFSIEELHMSLVRLHREIGKTSLTFRKIDTGKRKRRNSHHSATSEAPFFMPGITHEEGHFLEKADHADVDDVVHDSGSEDSEEDEEEELRRLEDECEELEMQIDRCGKSFVKLLEDHRREKHAFDAKRVNLMHELRRRTRNARSARVSTTSRISVRDLAALDCPPQELAVKSGDDDNEDGGDDDVLVALRCISNVHADAAHPCKKCGNPLIVMSKFCRVCGQSVPNEDEEETHVVTMENTAADEFEEKARELTKDNVSLEDDLFRLKCQLDLMTNSTREKASELKLAKEQLAVLEAETSRPESGIGMTAASEYARGNSTKMLL